MSPVAARSADEFEPGHHIQIGRSLARLLYDTGYQLTLADNNVEALRRASEQLSARAVPTDVADPDSVQALARVAGPCDLLCLNAGVTSLTSGPPWESSPDEWRRVVDVNLGGVVNGLRSFVPHMARRAGGSAILITASLAGVLTWPGGGPYAASKHALLAVAEQAALTLSAKGITVTVICPDLVRTGMSDQGESPDVTARRAMRAVQAGDFAVVPHSWDGAIRDRAERIIGSAQPAMPKPAGPLHSSTRSAT
jgi:NAD(P)-dependent dehydrogenase (short-subunit alcohol dehydrogenase family)